MAALLAKLGPQNAAPVPVEEHYLWPDNVDTWHHWIQVQNMWRSSVAGPPWFDYAGLGAYLDEQSLPADERRHLWDCITACERATLQAWAENAAAKKQ